LLGDGRDQLPYACCPSPRRRGATIQPAPPRDVTRLDHKVERDAGKHAS
jgi:hypothetical protein